MSGIHSSFYQKHKNSKSFIPREAANNLVSKLLDQIENNSKKIIFGEVLGGNGSSYHFLVNRLNKEDLEIFITDDYEISKSIYNIIKQGKTISSVFPDKNAN